MEKPLQIVSLDAMIDKHIGDIGTVRRDNFELENSITNARFDTILKVFTALGAKVNFNVELLNTNLATIA